MENMEFWRIDDIMMVKFDNNEAIIYRAKLPSDDNAEERERK